MDTHWNPKGDLSAPGDLARGIEVASVPVHDANSSKNMHP